MFNGQAVSFRTQFLAMKIVEDLPDCMTAFGTDGIRQDLSGKFKFTRPEVLTTMLFWDQPEEGASWSPQSWYLNTNLQCLQCVVPQKNGIFKFYFTSHQYKIMPLLYEDNTQRHYRFY